jgi:hypothetical protein
MAHTAAAWKQRAQLACNMIVCYSDCLVCLASLDASTNGEFCNQLSVCVCVLFCFAPALRPPACLAHALHLSPCSIILHLSPCIMPHICIMPHFLWLRVAQDIEVVLADVLARSGSAWPGDRAEVVQLAAHAVFSRPSGMPRRAGAGHLLPRRCDRLSVVMNVACMN